MSRLRWLGAAGGAAAAAGLAWAATSVVGSSSPAHAASPTTPANTVRITRRDLVTREDFDGTLAYDDERSLGVRRQGTFTALPREGQLLRRGDVILRVDTTPLFLLYGTQPAWRALARGDSGGDVFELQRNLRALGYDTDHDMTLDGEFDWDTEVAVKRFQEDHGLPETGKLELGTVTFLPGPRRVGTVDAEVGGTSGQTGLTTTSTRRVVSMTLDASNQTLVHVGQRVLVQLPDGERVPASVSEVGRVAHAPAASEDPNADTTPTIDVTVRLRGRVPGRLDQAPVTVKVTTESVKDALAVPVNALLAVTGGGYALEVVHGTGRKLVGVTPGHFADGWVAVSGAVHAGQRVVASQ